MCIARKVVRLTKRKRGGTSYDMLLMQVCGSVHSTP